MPVLVPLIEGGRQEVMTDAIIDVGNRWWVGGEDTRMVSGSDRECVGEWVGRVVLV